MLYMEGLSFDHSTLKIVIIWTDDYLLSNKMFTWKNVADLHKNCVENRSGNIKHVCTDVLQE